LLYFRDLKTGSLDLSEVSETLMPALMRSEPVRLSDLFGEDEHRTVVGRLLEIRRKAVENLEEKGLDTMHIGLGIATWAASDGGRPPAAPVFLVPVTIDLRGRDGLASAMRRVGDIGLNPVLLHVLEAEYAATVPAEEILQTVDEEGTEAGRDLSKPFLMLSASAAGVPGFTIQEKFVLGNFSFQKMRMVQDLKEYGEELVSHDLIAALAGDEDARSSISESRNALDPRSLDSMPVANDLLILDADSSQQAVIAAALSNQDGVIQGPPGTGKSQTIANAIASFIGAGKKVLFVAEKRAALEVVARRLQACGLGHVFLDLHGADIRRSEIAQRLAECLGGIKESPVVESTEPDQRLGERREVLNDHVKRMHSPRPPSGKSVYQIQGDLLRLPQDSHVPTRWKGKQLEALTSERVRKGVELLGEAAATPGLFLRTDPSPWTGAHIANESDLQTAIDITDRLADDIWPKFIHAIGIVTAESGLANPVFLPEAADLLGLVGDVQKILVDWNEQIFDLDLKQTLKQLSPASSGPVRRVISWCVDPGFRLGLRQVALVSRHAGGSWKARRQVAEQADDARTRWDSKSHGAGRPCAVPSFLGAAKMSTRLHEDLKTLQPIIVAADLTAMGLDVLGALLLALREDRTTPYLLPNLARIERELAGLGFESLVVELRRGKPRPEVWGDSLIFAWLSSLIEAERAADPVLAAFNGRLHDRIVEDFQDRDQDRLDIATLLVRRLHAERAVAAMNEHRDQDGMVRREAGKKKRHLPVRQLLAQASDVVLSLCPCWMASPLSVSHLLDGRRKYFDVVIFDEASQVPPEDAIPSILRGRRAIVAGDRHQLPPTTFFDADTEDESELDAADPTVGFESVLDIMSAFLEPWTLDWHYRSRDERLIAFSNRWIYGNRLITFPGIGGSEALSHVPAPPGIEHDPD
jgi:hypothetical protein